MSEKLLIAGASAVIFAVVAVFSVTSTGYAWDIAIIEWVYAMSGLGVGLLLLDAPK